MPPSVPVPYVLVAQAPHDLIVLHVRRARGSEALPGPATPRALRGRPVNAPTADGD
ncbi:hypothetical protein AB0G35_17275 [Streptomyces sp. NPDC021749]|uniref:hypothetical protein n=1 Tax=Streptomyces sp. NPDC021749 TaxID=3154905 RepID=UPI0033C55DCC